MNTAEATSRWGASVEVRGLTRCYGERVVFKDLDLDIGRGEFVALLGRSGGGKTTLLRTMGGLDQVQAGTVRVPKARSIVFQEHRLLPWLPVWRNVVIGIRGRGARQMAEGALAEVGLAGHADVWPLTLSGGEAQRAALARALVREPELLLLDEPFGALDALTRVTMQALVLELYHRHRPAILLVTHDVEEALVLADRVIVLRDGRLEEHVVASGQRRWRRTDREFESARTRLLELLGAGDDLETVEELSKAGEYKV